MNRRGPYWTSAGLSSALCGPRHAPDLMQGMWIPEHRYNDTHLHKEFVLADFKTWVCVAS